MIYEGYEGRNIVEKKYKIYVWYRNRKGKVVFCIKKIFSLGII